MPPSVDARAFGTDRGRAAARGTVTGDRDPYKVLGVDRGADPEVVAAAYRALARRHHPDVSRSPDAERRMAEINAAWTILRDPASRAAWDRDHGVIRARTGPATGPLASAGSQASAARPAAGPSDRRSAKGSATEWRRGPEGEGAAGPPPGPQRGTVLSFGRHIGWSLGEVARADPGYLQWLAVRREGAPYREEIEALLGPMFRGAAPSGAPTGRRGLFRRG